MGSPISRRDFLKINGLALGSLAFRPFIHDIPPAWLKPDDFETPIGRARVTIGSIYIYSEPDFDSKRIGSLTRDKLTNIYEEITSSRGPRRNPLWYRLANGFVHSAYLQRVDKAHLNTPLDYVLESGRLGEITVPYTQSFRKTLTYGWVPLYRLYYQSIFWITGIEEGPNGKPWYALTDDLLHVQYCVPAIFMRPIDPQETSPISPDVPSKDKRIEVSISQQTLTAYEGDQVVLKTKVSSGIPSNGPTPNGIPTETPKGYFHIEVKLPSRHMGDGNLTNKIGAYELPGVPWVSFFHVTGVGFHGTYWHNNFGSMMSHGCVNMRTEDARWLYRWSAPTAEADDWHRKGHGTLVRVV